MRRASGVMLGERAPIICLVTDRRRLCAAGDTQAVECCLLAQVREAVEAGVDLVQIRERGLEDAQLARLVSQAVAVARGTATAVVVNDRIDVALACGAGGVHLRADSIPPAGARSIAPRGFLIGRSVHGAEEALRVSAEVDYLIAGTVFPTASKPGVDRLLGEAGLAEVVRAVGMPVLAIGGVTIANIPRLASAGAAGIAAVGLFLNAAGPPPCRVGAVGAAVAAVRARFDRAKPVSLT